MLSHAPSILAVEVLGAEQAEGEGHVANCTGEPLPPIAALNMLPGIQRREVPKKTAPQTSTESVAFVLTVGTFHPFV